MNAEEIDNDVNDMWRLMYKLNKTFGDVTGPRMLADKIRRKIEQFKSHLPLLHVICNPGAVLDLWNNFKIEHRRFGRYIHWILLKDNVEILLI